MSRRNYCMNAEPHLEFQAGLPLQADGKFHEGTLMLVVDGKPTVQVRATSGHSPHQGLDSFWLRGKGPLPPSNVIAGTYRVDTTLITAGEKFKVAMGERYFHIVPDPVFMAGYDSETVKNSETDPHCRTQLCLHYDGGSAGTSGCIGVRPRLTADEQGWKVLRDAIVALGVDSLQLSVNYYVI
jgi:hypothetical protein